jgi:hypothetical protein
MRIVCKKHRTQEVVFYALNGRINRKCTVCQIEYEIKKYKGIKNEKLIRFKDEDKSGKLLTQ